MSEAERYMKFAVQAPMVIYTVPAGGGFDLSLSLPGCSEGRAQM